jgi:hypothetical protein
MNILKITQPVRPWYQIIIWWELRRIPFNIIMYFIGVASFYIGYITIPLLYIILGLLLNIGYTLGWIIELIVIKDLGNGPKMKYPSIAFFTILALSMLIVFGIPTLLML